MFDFLRCKRCNSTLVYDRASTVEHQYQEAKNNLRVVPTSVSDFLVYTCGGCGLEHRYKFSDLERMEREFVNTIVESKLVKEDQKILQDYAEAYVECGLCSGLNGQGRCLKDIYDKCTRRRVKSGLQPTTRSDNTKF